MTDNTVFRECKDVCNSLTGPGKGRVAAEAVKIVVLETAMQHDPCQPCKRG
jgi:hypothetical protein